MSTSIDCPVTFSLELGNTFMRCELPPNVKIGSNAFGQCLRVARPLQKGEVIYHGWMKLEQAKNYDLDYPLFIKDPATGAEITVPINRDVHNVPFGSHFQVYSFCSLTNHSCEGSLMSKNWIIHENGLVEYDVVALKDLVEDEELHCDYSLFYYDCTKLQDSPSCLCGSSRCRGKIMGFSQLSLQDQLDILPDIFPPLMSMFLRDHRALHLGDLAVPPHWRLEKSTDEKNMYWTVEKDFIAGEVLAEQSGAIVPSDIESVCFCANGRYFLHSTMTLPGPTCVEQKDRTKVCVPLMHSLANSGDDDASNCEVRILENKMIVRAIKAISAGDELRARAKIVFK